MDSKTAEGETCAWCVAATTLKEKLTGIKSAGRNTGVLCFAAAMAVLILLAITWAVTLIIN